MGVIGLTHKRVLFDLDTHAGGLEKLDDVSSGVQNLRGR